MAWWQRGYGWWTSFCCVMTRWWNCELVLCVSTLIVVAPTRRFIFFLIPFLVSFDCCRQRRLNFLIIKCYAIAILTLTQALSRWNNCSWLPFLLTSSLYTGFYTVEAVVVVLTSPEYTRSKSSWKSISLGKFSTVHALSVSPNFNKRCQGWR